MRSLLYRIFQLTLLLLLPSTLAAQNSPMEI